MYGSLTVISVLGWYNNAQWDAIIERDIWVVYLGSISIYYCCSINKIVLYSVNMYVKVLYSGIPFNVLLL